MYSSFFLIRDNSPSNSRFTSSLVSELDRVFRDLDLLQRRISSVRAALSRRCSFPGGPVFSSIPVAVLVPPDDSPTAVVSSSSRDPLLPGGSICAGDLVRILNPRSFQQSQSVASYSQGHFIYIRTPNGFEVHRYEKIFFSSNSHSFLFNIYHRRGPRCPSGCCSSCSIYGSGSESSGSSSSHFIW